MRVYEGTHRKRVLALMASRIAGPLMVQAIEAWAESEDDDLGLEGRVADVAITLSEAILARLEMLVGEA
jgi:hypothetical protein